MEDTLNYNDSLTFLKVPVNGFHVNHVNNDDSTIIINTKEQRAMSDFCVISEPEFVSEIESSGRILQIDAGLSQLLGTTVYDVKDQGSLAGVASTVIESGMETSTFLVCNLASVMKQLIQWREQLPMVEPFYAVKCNPDPVIVRLLASLGCNFDCATMGEIDLVSNLLGDKLSLSQTAGATSRRIVYANPAKMEHMLEFARDTGVQMTVFDGEDELYKIAKVARGCGRNYGFKLLLRITTEDKASKCPFSKKFGCPYKDALDLLKVAQRLGLHVAGVSFHVGSGCGDATAYNTALKHAAQIFRWAEELSMPPMSIIDIGGGFPGDQGGNGLPSFLEIAAVVRSSIVEFCESLQRPQETIQFIAEPGRYFVHTCTMIATKIYSRKGGSGACQALYVDNGVYGSFNTVVYDHGKPVCKKLTANPVPCSRSSMERSGSACSFSSFSGSDCDGNSMPRSGSGCESVDGSLSRSNSSGSLVVDAAPLIPTAIFGPTCDGLDQMCSMESFSLERCEVGEWLVWEDHGAYTHTASFVFNGFTHLPQKLHCFLI